MGHNCAPHKITENAVLALKGVFDGWLSTLSLCVSFTEKKCNETGTLKRNVLSHWSSNLTVTSCAVTTWRYWNSFFLGSVGQQRDRFRSFLELQTILVHLGILKHILELKISFSFCRSLKVLQQQLIIWKFKVICTWHTWHTWHTIFYVLPTIVLHYLKIICRVLAMHIPMYVFAFQQVSLLLVFW